MNPTKNPIALNLPTVATLLIVYARHIVACMTNNSWFTTPNPSLANVTTHVDALDTCEVAVRAKAPGSVEARDVQMAVVGADMSSLKTYVWSVAVLNLAQALAIIASSGLPLRRFTIRQKAQLAALMGATPGEVVLRAKAAGARVIYTWQVSMDGGKTWTTIGVTNVANTTLAGQTPGTTCSFRFCATVKKVTGEWSQTVSLLIH